MKRIGKVAVLGAGTMGARIAAHLANAGIPALLLDIVPAGAEGAARNQIAAAGLDAAVKSKPAAFFDRDLVRLVQIGNFEDDLQRLAECDWIIEAVVEDLAIKRALLQRVEQVRRPGTIITTNTSGLPVQGIAEGFSDDFRRHWFGTHFFNPPRYMRLLEIIATPATDPAAIAAVEHFCDLRLGKGIVRAKDTPNFIANRIGTFSVLNVMRLMQEMDLSIEDVDALTGSAVGWPRSATFRTLDLVGLDILAHVVRNMAGSRAAAVAAADAGESPASTKQGNLRAAVVTAADAGESSASTKQGNLRLPDFCQQMLERKWLGDKTGGGFYKKQKSPGQEDERLALDWKTLEYRPRQKPRFAALEMAKNIDSTPERLRNLLALEGGTAAPLKTPEGKFLWAALADLWNYAADRIPEISDTVVEIDRAMRLGFNWELGPFELWDAAGVAATVARMRAEGRTLSANVEKLLATGHPHWYEAAPEVPAGRSFFDLDRLGYRPESAPEGVWSVTVAKKSGTKVVKKNAGASLVDLGDGVGCFEFHSKMNALGGDIIQLIVSTLKPDSALGAPFDAFVLHNDGPHFSVGANLMLLLMAVQEDDWEEVDLAIRGFQQMTQAVKFSAKPVVAAPFNMALGGGCEISLHGAARQPHAELYMGLVEVGVGLLPAGGGCKEMLLRALDAAAAVRRSTGAAPAADSVEVMEALKRTFETIAMGKVSTSAMEARGYGFLAPGDRITMNRERVLTDAKACALELARSGYRAPAPRSEAPAPGESILATLKLGVHFLRQGEFISDHEVKIGNKVAEVLCGGAVSPGTPVSEQYLLDLEREAFKSLCGERKTQERIQYTLKTGKTLRN